MLTNAPNQRKLAKLIPALWKRHGREDLSVAGMLLANLDSDALGQDAWMAFIHLLQRKEALMVVLEVAEELVRAGHKVRMMGGWRRRHFNHRSGINTVFCFFR